MFIFLNHINFTHFMTAVWISGPKLEQNQILIFEISYERKTRFDNFPDVFSHQFRMLAEHPRPLSFERDDCLLLRTQKIAKSFLTL